ncbi:uncharacterized protein LOC141645993 [Silene latifolia]|uniref:uncharacterized protein LOC141645993 n=1 Tax=Silene latifolia TaxID=37657 RepID=UPI003D776615
MEDDEYEDSRQFLCMLDAAAERIFEACSEFAGYGVMAAESSAIAIACETEAFRQGTSNLLQDSELRLELNPMNTLPPTPPQESSSPCRPLKRRKRSWTPDQPVLEQSFPVTKINIIPTQITWAGMPLGGFKAKETFTFSNNFCHDQRRGSKNNTVGWAGSSVNSFLTGGLLPPITASVGKSETEDVKKCDDFSKELHDVVHRIESLLPSLQKWVSSVQKPANHQKGVKVSTISEETSGSSLGYSSGTSTHQSGYSYPSSFSGSTYSSVSAENENEDEEVGQSSTESCTDYETASYDSQDQYSDTSEDSSERPHKLEDHHLETRKRVGRLSKIGKKLGLIFHHHHHHHHHHYSGRDETGLGHVGFLKRVGKMFHRRGKSDDGQRQKPEKSRKPVTKCVTKKRQDGGHFRALIDGLMRHKKHSKKTEKGKDEIGRLGSVGHKGKRGTKKVSWWPKMGRNKAKVANKGKVKLGRAMTRAKRSQFAAAKMILK